jgi:hypothetical protein
MALTHFETLVTATNSGIIATSTKTKTNGTALATWQPPFACYLNAAWVEVTEDIDPGSTVAGVIGVYNGTTLLGSLTLATTQDAGECWNIPLTTASTQVLAITDKVYLKVVTAPTGGTIDGTVRLHLLCSYDPRDTTAPETTGYFVV